LTHDSRCQSGFCRWPAGTHALRPAAPFSALHDGDPQLDEFRTHEEAAPNAPTTETKSMAVLTKTPQPGRRAPGGRRAVGSRRAARRHLAADGAPATRHPPPSGGWVRWSAGDTDRQRKGSFGDIERAVIVTHKDHMERSRVRRQGGVRGARASGRGQGKRERDARARLARDAL
jgi:hypothetical protein